MKLILLRYTPEPDRIVAISARRCYSCRMATDIDEKMSNDEVKKLLGFLRKRNHLSPFEHANFTFSVDGISRALSHQLVRHRIASYSQESQRYVNYMNKELLFVVPPRIKANIEANKIFEETALLTLKAYRKLVEIGVPKEDARYIFPNAVETKFVFTMNARSLFNFFEQRCCLKAQWEIRQMAMAMLQEVRKVAPMIFADAGAPCGYEQPYCRENDESCPLFTKIKNINNSDFNVQKN